MNANIYCTSHCVYLRVASFQVISLHQSNLRFFLHGQEKTFMSIKIMSEAVLSNLAVVYINLKMRQNMWQDTVTIMKVR